MKPEEIHFWQLIAETIGKENPKIYCFIMDHLESDETKGFNLITVDNYLRVETYPKGMACHDDLILPIDYPLEYQDPPGTFEGMPIDLVEP